MELDTAKYICKQMGYDSLINFGPVRDNPFLWFKHDIPLSSEFGIKCGSSIYIRCIDSMVKKCADAEYFMTISCGCSTEHLETEGGCGKCPDGATVDEKTGICKNTLLTDLS